MNAIKIIFQKFQQKSLKNIKNKLDQIKNNYLEELQKIRLSPRIKSTVGSKQIVNKNIRDRYHILQEYDRSEYFENNENLIGNPRFFNDNFGSEQLLVRGEKILKKFNIRPIRNSDKDNISEEEKASISLKEENCYLITFQANQKCFKFDDERIILTCWINTRDQKFNIFQNENFRNFLKKSRKIDSEPISIEMLDREFPFPIDPDLKREKIIWSDIFKKYYKGLKTFDTEFQGVSTEKYFKEPNKKDYDYFKNFLKGDLKSNITESLLKRVIMENRIDVKAIEKIERIECRNIDIENIELIKNLSLELYNGNNKKWISKFFKNKTQAILKLSPEEEAWKFLKGWYNSPSFYPIVELFPNSDNLSNFDNSSMKSMNNLIFQKNVLEISDCKGKSNDFLLTNEFNESEKTKKLIHSIPEKEEKSPEEEEKEKHYFYEDETKESSTSFSITSGEDLK